MAARRPTRCAQRVERRFWNEARDYYGLAIDGEGELCRPMSSNPGHLLFVGLPAPERAARSSTALLSPKFDSGWGLRTIATDARALQSDVLPQRFGVAARHGARRRRHGAVWRPRGPDEDPGRLFGVAKAFQMRMPELLCGFAREPDAPPIAYPSACVPQAWAAGSTFMMLQACLGLTIDAARREVRIVRPSVAGRLDTLSLRDLTVGRGPSTSTSNASAASSRPYQRPSARGAISVIIEG